ncbi:MAG: outer membrane beta-barrel protein [Opitutales bacterium]
MKNKRFYSINVISLAGMFLTSGHAFASPLVTIGDNTDVYFNGSSSLRWSSNIFLNGTNEEEDLSWTVSPGFEVNVGRGLSSAELSVITRYDIVRYDDLDDLDTELFHIKAIGSYESSRLELGGSVSFDEAKANRANANLVGDLIETDTSKAAFDAEYKVSPKLSIGSGVLYDEREYQAPFNDRFADREKLSLPVDIFYELTPKVDLILGYRHTRTEIEGTVEEKGTASEKTVSGYDMEDEFFSIGARGDLLPKVSGLFKIGYREGSQDDSIVTPAGGGTLPKRKRKDKNGLGIDADFSWELTPKIMTKLGLSRDFGVSGTARTSEDTTVSLSASYVINSDYALSGQFSYTNTEFTNTELEDDQYIAGVRLFYTPSEYWNVSAGYNYDENDSTRAGRSYDQHVFELTANLRY